MHNILLYIAGALPLLWGLAHLFPTKAVVRAFGNISRNNRHIITMEWIIEGLTLMFLGFLTIIITAVNPTTEISKTVYWSVFWMLNVLSVVSLFTGFKVNFILFKLCPFIFTGSAVLIMIALIL